MEGCCIPLVNKLAACTPTQAKRLLKPDKSRAYELTRSILNLLHNASKVGSLNSASRHKQFLKKKKRTVVKLIVKKLSYAAKLEILLRNPELAIFAASLCPGAGL